MDANSVTAVATVLIAMFTIVLAIGGAWQVILTRRAIIKTNDQHVVSNRAFIYIKHFLYMPSGNQADTVKSWRITPVYENSGNTPTRRLISGHSAELRTTVLPKDFTYPDLRWPPDGREFYLSRDFIGPKVLLNNALYELHIEDVISIAREEQYFFIWGWSDYDDVFPGTGRHRLEYCFRLMVLFDPTNPKNTSALTMAQWGNNAVDDECLRQPAPYTPP